MLVQGAPTNTINMQPSDIHCDNFNVKGNKESDEFLNLKTRACFMYCFPITATLQEYTSTIYNLWCRYDIYIHSRF